MRWIIRILATVLGSVVFLPVSCTMGTFVGTHLFSIIDARDVEKGESVHYHFNVVAEPGKDGMPFRVIDLSLIEWCKELIERNKINSFCDEELKSVSFLMSESSGSIDSNVTSYEYRVLEEARPKQLIEVVESGENRFWSRYKVTESTITPISSRAFHHSYMFGAIPFAIGFALILYLVGRILRHVFEYGV